MNYRTLKFIAAKLAKSQETHPFNSPLKRGVKDELSPLKRGVKDESSPLKRGLRSESKRRFLNFARMAALVSVTLGTMALIISLSVLDGFDKTLHENAVKFTAHITVKTLNRKPSLDFPKNIIKLKQSIPEIKSAIPIVERECLVKSKSFVEGIFIRGVYEPNYFSNYSSDNSKLSDEYISPLSLNMVEGKFDFKENNESKNEKIIIIGRRLSKKLNVKLGDWLVIYSIKNIISSQTLTGNQSLTKIQTESQFPTIDKFRIGGIYETGMAQYDDSYCFISYKAGLRLFGMPQNSASGYEIFLKDISDAPRIAGVVDDVLGFPHISYTVFELHSAIFAWIELQKAPIPLVLGLISIVAVLNIITILLITVVEKTHSIGILRALGMQNKDIMSIFVIQGTGIAIAGSIIGSILALSFAILQNTFQIIHLEGDIYYLDALPVDIAAWHYIIVFIITIFLAFISTLIPAVVATKVSPIKAIRFR